MAGLDDLISQIPIADIASKLGADQGEVASAVQQLVPALVGGLQVNVQDDKIDSSKLEEAVSSHAVSGLLDGGVNVNDVDENEGDQIVSRAGVFVSDGDRIAPVLEEATGAVAR